MPVYESEVFCVSRFQFSTLCGKMQPEGLIHIIKKVCWWSSHVPHLFVSLTPAPGIPDGADDTGPSQCVVPQQPRSVGQVMAIRVGTGVRVGHGGDNGGLHHPL